MSTSNNTGGASRGSWRKYANMNCPCRLVADIKVSLSVQNPGRLYYACQEKKCKWLGWCEPVEDDADGKSKVQTNDPSGDARMSNLECELKKLDDLVDGMKEGMQEEFATVKFELDNAIIATNKDVDNKLSLLKSDFDEELLDVKTELKQMKKTNGNLKYGIIGLLFIIFLVFIANHI
jgi:hypothetical protein